MSDEIQMEQKLYRFMEIDTCPMCGGEIYVQDNGVLGQQDIKKIPGDTVFRIRCTDATGTTLMCGEFQIRRVHPETLDDDWVATWLSTPGIWG
jgi:hypothetical protein